MSRRRSSAVRHRRRHITLKEGAQLDYEAHSSYDLDVRSTDGAGNSIVKTVTINVTT